ncbi:MAG: hypothetical protein AB1551_06780 [Actinomycetota bacterium]
MKRTVASGIGLVLGVLVALGLLAMAGHTAPQPFPNGTPIGPKMERDTGAGEMLLVVLGGVYGTRAEAEAVNSQMSFGDVAGFYVVPVAQFQGFREQIGSPGDFALVSAFRTDQGAQEFAAFAQSLGYPATILSSRVHSLGGQYAGLGQEANPNGLGPLTGPIRASLP